MAVEKHLNDAEEADCEGHADDKALLEQMSRV